MPPSALVQLIYLTFVLTLRPAEMRRRAHAGFYCRMATVDLSLSDVPMLGSSMSCLLCTLDLDRCGSNPEPIVQESSVL